MSISKSWLPDCLAHLNKPYISQSDRMVVIGEISSVPYSDYEGTRLLHTILIPHSRLEEVLNQPGGIGWKVQSHGPLPVVSEGQTYNSGFWVEGPSRGEDRFEPLVHSWESSNETVMIPNDGILMCYGLVPRVLISPDKIIWDEPSKPEKNIVEVIPSSHYDTPTHSGARIKIRNDYLEDFAGLKGGSVAAVFYEERYCQIDQTIRGALNGQQVVEHIRPGHRLVISTVPHKGPNYVLCKIWGCRLVMKPNGRPISEEEEPKLEWPDYPGIMTCDRACSYRHFNYVHVSDEVLSAFEGRPEFETSPVHGSISFGVQWSLSYSHRVGRDYIAFELKKLYEGCHPSIIRSTHGFAVAKALAEAQEAELGNKNIGTRAEALIEAFLNLGDSLLSLSDLFSLPFEAEDFIGLSRHNVEYSGWWRTDALKDLGYRAPLDMTRGQFLERCKTVQLLIEKIKEKALRRLVNGIGLDPAQTKDMSGSLKLLSTLLQLCHLSNKSGLCISTQGDELAARWNKDIRLEDFPPLFALVDLRNAASHDLGAEETQKVREALERFGIYESEMVDGWGRELDRIYDVIIVKLNSLSELMRSVVSDAA